MLGRGDSRGLARLGAPAGIGDAGPDRPPAAGLRSGFEAAAERAHALPHPDDAQPQALSRRQGAGTGRSAVRAGVTDLDFELGGAVAQPHGDLGAGSRVARADRKRTRLNSSHVSISYAVVCLKTNIRYRSSWPRTRPVA